MKIKTPQPFTFEAGERAVLLLHGFTGHTADVRMLGRYLEKEGYTSHAPIFRGHGLPPEQLIKSNPDEWWEDTLKGYDYLKELGYENIAVAGLSMGGALSLKLASCREVRAVIPMCTPVYFDNQTKLKGAFELFAKQYKQLENKSEETIDRELDTLLKKSEPLFEQIKHFTNDIRKLVDLIYTPTLVVQSRLDEIINPESANYIYEHVETDEKELKWYEESGHVITLDKERDQLHEDIHMFLESISWE